MIRRALICAILVSWVIAPAPSGASDASEPPATFATVPCTTPFFATLSEGNVNAVLVRAVDLWGRPVGNDHRIRQQSDVDRDHPARAGG